MNLRDYLADRKITRDEFARIVGAGSALTVGKWIRGERFPRPAMLRRIERMTGGLVTASDFLPEESERRRPRKRAA